MGNTVRDYAFYQRKRELADRRKAQDQYLGQLHAGFDLSAQDNHMKYERPQFAVVTASEAYRDGWDAIFGKTIGNESGSEQPSSNLMAAPECPTGA